MEVVQLGRTGLKVSRLCLGTMTFGASCGLEEARRIADVSLERGAFFWDTADMYSTGRCEEIVGDLLATRRQDVVLATKVFATMSDRPNDRGLSARHILQACEDSLRRLKTDWIDLYYLHFPDPTTPLDETLRAVEDLVRSGKVRYIGCSNYKAWQVVDMIHRARAHGWQEIAAVQPLYNVLNRDIEVELLPMCQELGLGAVTYSPLARGVLTGKYRWDAPPPEGSRLGDGDARMRQAEWRHESLAVVEQLVPLARELGCTPAQLAIAWALANKNVSSVILGARTLDQAITALDAAALTIPPELEAAIDAIVPPGCHSGKAFPDQEKFPITGRRLA